MVYALILLTEKIHKIAKIFKQSPLKNEILERYVMEICIFERFKSDAKLRSDGVHY